MKPLYQTRATPDVLIDVAGKLRSPVAMTAKSYEDALKASPAAPGPRAAGTEKRPAVALTYEPAHFDGDPAAYPYHFQPYASQSFDDGSVAHLPWLQEMPDPMTSAMWSSWVEINPQTAEKLQIKRGDVVEITSSQGSVRASAVLSQGIGPDAVAMPVGQGHETFTRYASRRGANPIAILAPVADAATGALAWSATRVKIARVGDADGSLILFAGETHENP